MIGGIAAAMLVAFAIAASASCRGSVPGRFVAMQLASVIVVQLTLVLSLQQAVSYYADAALLLAVIAVVGSLLFARFLERWL